MSTLAALLGTVPPATAIGRPLRQALASTTARPRVLALFVLDGTRADYFDTYAGVMPTLSRLRREGAWFSNAHVTSAPTLTAVGHANLGTGAEPRIHGLAVNYLFNRVTGKLQEAYNGFDPGELMALTLADVWNIETEGRAIIIGQGGAMRATAGLVGHGACLVNGRRVLAASYSTRDAGWETNPTCYAMSDALKPINARKHWEAVDGKWMGHDISDASKFRHSAVFQRFEGDALASVLEREPIGADDVTDLVLVNLKAPTMSDTHTDRPLRDERELTELDRQIARALTIIARKSRRGPIRRDVHRRSRHAWRTPSRGRHYMDDIHARRQALLAVRGTVVQYYDDAANNEIHLDTAKLRTLGFVEEVASFLESQDFSPRSTPRRVRIAQSRLALRAQ